MRCKFLYVVSAVMSLGLFLSTTKGIDIVVQPGGSGGGASTNVANFWTAPQRFQTNTVVYWQGTLTNWDSSIGRFYDNTGILSIDYNGRSLQYGQGNLYSVDWAGGILKTISGGGGQATSINWDNFFLSYGAAVRFTWDANGNVFSGPVYMSTNTAPHSFVTNVIQVVGSAYTNGNFRSRFDFSATYTPGVGGVANCELWHISAGITNKLGPFGIANIATETAGIGGGMKVDPNAIVKIVDTSSGGGTVTAIKTIVAKE